jgi:PUA domain protein
MEVKSRHHLRSDEVQEIEQRLADRLGVELDADSYELVELEDSEFDLVLVDGDPAVLYVEREANASDGSSSAERSSADSRAATPRDDGDAPRDKEPFLTVRGANRYEPQIRVVTVDAGAISFVSDGADVMRPGITEADDYIAAGDLVAIAEESHGKVLAIGRAKTDGDDMVGDEGKVVSSVHHVGDELYEFTV